MQAGEAEPGVVRTTSLLSARNHYLWLVTHPISYDSNMSFGQAQLCLRDLLPFTQKYIFRSLTFKYSMHYQRTQSALCGKGREL